MQTEKMEIELAAMILRGDDEEAIEQLDRMALEDRSWRRKLAMAKRLNNPLPPLPMLAIPEPLPVPGIKPGGTVNREGQRRCRAYWRDQAKDKAA